MSMRGALFAAIAMMPLPMVPVMAQSAQSAAVVAHPATTEAAPSVENASLQHSALKATTFKVGSTITNVALLSYAAGGIFGGTALSAFMLGSSWLLYTANDYMWDKYDPPPARVDGQPFDTAADAWRNTLKYLTYKPVIASIKLASLYVYTGSAGVAAVFGIASVITNTGVFYVNNMAWDMYDWYARPSAPATPTGH